MDVRTMLKGRPARWVMALAWMGVIFALSSQSGLPSAPDETLDFVLKKTGHFLEYALLAVLLLRAIYPSGALSKRRLLLPLVIASLFAGSDEFHQSFTATRHPSPRDVGIDTAGACLGLLVYALRPRMSS